MSEHVHACLLIALKHVVQFVQFISICANKVTVVENTYWVGVHVYAIENWKRMQHLVHLSCVPDVDSADHLTTMIMGALFEEGRLSCKEIASKLVYFGADGVSTSQGPPNGITIQIWKKWSIFLLKATCVSHRVNLIVETLSKYPLVS